MTVSELRVRRFVLKRCWARKFELCQAPSLFAIKEHSEDDHDNPRRHRQWRHSRLDRSAGRCNPNKDLDRLRQCYAPDIVSFDVGPRLQDIGVEGKLNNWREAFAVLQPPLGYDVHNLSVTVEGALAFVHGINRLSGTLDGNRIGSWVRWTACMRKLGDDWAIVHDQVSFPVDPTSARAVLDLEPAS